jgi:alcohol dehydrogenase class IV
MLKFGFARCPRIYFGPGTFRELREIVPRWGRKALIVTGASSFQASGRLEELQGWLDEELVSYFHVAVKGEPSPELVDGMVEEYRGSGIEVVLSVGGGSAIDAGKAISAMLLEKDSVLDYLEEVGGKEHSGRKVPFIAVPTTAGTGSEATRNAVLSRVGPDGFKKSLRHDNFVPEVAVVDPELALSCPTRVTASSGMDALTQLLESYVSPGSSPLTDALALSGMERVRDNLLPACGAGSSDVEVRAGMAYAALLSGITLANAGLGVVHGFAAAIGGLYSIPHGVICGTLLGAAVRANISALRGMGAGGEAALKKYARAGALLSGGEKASVDEGCALLVEVIQRWTRELHLPRLGEFGITSSDVDGIVERTEPKNNPAPLDRRTLRSIILERL